jgi:hypothetical protein
MSDNEYPFSILRDSEILAVNNFPLNVVPQFIKTLDDDSKGSSPIVVEESFDVFKENIRYSFVSENATDFKKESTASIFCRESRALSSNAESRARESAA